MAGRKKVEEPIREVYLKREVMDGLVATGEEYEVRDTDLRGFGVRVSKRGVRTFIFRWSVNARDARRAIGRYPDLSVSAARHRAEDWRGRIARGEDPRTERREALAAKTVREWLTTFKAEHVVRLAASTAKDYTRIIDKRLIPLFGRLLVTDLNEEHVRQLHHDLRATPREANKTVSILSKALNLAERAGQRPKRSNPCYMIERFPEQTRTRALTLKEAAAFGKILKKKEAHSPKAVAIIMLLLMTGARLGEIEKLEWAWVDLEGGVIRIPPMKHKTGKKTGRERIIALGPAAVVMLSRLAKGKLSKWVFPADTRPVRTATRKPHLPHYSSTKAVWQRMRRKGATKEEDGELRKAGLTDLHLHDLRHTFASWARVQGMSLDDLGDVLGHTDPRMTKKYAHAVVEKMREDVGPVEDSILQRLGR